MSDTLQRAITEWAIQTFGVQSEEALVARGNKEMAELISAIVNRAPRKVVVEECADVAFFLHQICEFYGVDLEHEVTGKLIKNKKRKWLQLEDGSFQHE